MLTRSERRASVSGVRCLLCRVVTRKRPSRAPPSSLARCLHTLPGASSSLRGWNGGGEPRSKRRRLLRGVCVDAYSSRWPRRSPRVRLSFIYLMPLLCPWGITFRGGCVLAPNVDIYKYVRSSSCLSLLVLLSSRVSLSLSRGPVLRRCMCLDQDLAVRALLCLPC